MLNGAKKMFHLYLNSGKVSAKKNTKQSDTRKHTSVPDCQFRFFHPVFTLCVWSGFSFCSRHFLIVAYIYLFLFTE